jgi:hypothetical protein
MKLFECCDPVDKLCADKCIVIIGDGVEPENCPYISWSGNDHPDWYLLPSDWKMTLTIGEE